MTKSVGFGIFIVQGGDDSGMLEVCELLSDGFGRIIPRRVVDELFVELSEAIEQLQICFDP